MTQCCRLLYKYKYFVHSTKHQIKIYIETKQDCRSKNQIVWFAFQLDCAGIAIIISLDLIVVRFVRITGAQRIRLFLVGFHLDCVCSAMTSSLDLIAVRIVSVNVAIRIGWLYQLVRFCLVCLRICMTTSLGLIVIHTSIQRYGVYCIIENQFRICRPR